MVEETGYILRVAGGRAQVEFVRQTACNGCSATNACGAGVLGTLFGRRRLRVWLDNSVDGVPGDRVVVGVNEAEFVATSVAAYLVPLLLLFVGAVAADALWKVGEGNELPAVLGAAAGLGLGVLGLRHWAGSGSGTQNLRILRKEPNVATAVRIS